MKAIQYCCLAGFAVAAGYAYYIEAYIAVVSFGFATVMGTFLAVLACRTDKKLKTFTKKQRQIHREYVELLKEPKEKS